MIIFTDIDDTLMKSSRKLLNLTANMQVGALNHKGENNSFIDSKRWALIQELLMNQICIPVTARSKSSFNNLVLKFKHHAIVSFGATIVDANNNIDKDWAQIIYEKSQQLNQASIFQIIKEKLLTQIKKFEVKIIKDENVPCYLNFKNISGDNLDILVLKKSVQFVLNDLKKRDDFYFYENGKDLAVVPNFISKVNGVRHLMEHHYDQKELMVGLGDHENDLSFMKSCDFIMVPTDSTLMKLIDNKLKE